MSDESLVPVFIPPLVTLLAHEERSKGAPLTQDEVISARGRGVCMMMRQSMAIEMAKKRGYDDIDPQNVWEEWQAIRESLPKE